MSDKADNFKLTKDQLLAANTYIPMAKKDAFVHRNAERCFDRLQITVGDEKVPPMYMENPTIKARYMMTALVLDYLKLPCRVEADDEDLMSEESYDEYAGEHIFMQLERFKKADATRDMCYDLLHDYFDLNKRFDTQIRGILAAKNDTVSRQQQMNAAVMADMPKMLEELEAMAQKRRQGEVKEHGGV